MGRGGKVRFKRSTRRRVQSKDRVSDESDEDYNVGEDGECDESDEYCSFDGDESEESLGEFDDEKEDEEEEKEMNVKKVVFRSKAQKGYLGRKANGVKKPQKKRVSYKQEDDDDYDDGDESEESLGEFEDEKGEGEEEEEETKVKKKVFRSKAQKGFPGRKANAVKNPRKKKRFSYKQEDDDDYDDDEEEEEDEEFTLDEIDCVDDDDDDDDDDELPVTKKNKKVGQSRSMEKGFAKERKRKRNSKVLKKPMRKKPRKNLRLAKKTSSGNGGKFTDKNLVLEEKSRKISGQRRRRFIADSDSDFVISGSSDYEYTVSEEEREQVREASKLCTSLTTNLRSSSSSKRLQEEEALCQKRKRPGQKGKEKVEDLKNEVGKQVCGICLSEEGKKTVQGTLNCCDHFFCFACIMEWSKVESRCPLCKQRFITISKTAKSNTGFDLRTVVIQVPERDQIYQPSEEELRGYLDPYENVICTECQQGGDDALMLLCDICDSSAHTYCVGLGREVPDGNWYCEGCRPTAFDSLNPQGLNLTPDRRASNNLSGMSSPVFNVGEGIDLNSMYVPDTPVTQEIGGFSSSRRPVGDFHAASPASGTGALTVLDRRRIQRQIHNLLNSRMNYSGVRSNGISATNSGIRLFGSQIDQGRTIASQRTITPERVESLHTFSDRRLQDTTPSVRNWDFFPARSSRLRERGQNPTSTSVDGTLQAELAGISMALNSRLAYEQLHPCSSRSSIGSDASMSPFACREVSHFNVEKGQVQQMVRSHLKSLSRDIELGHSTFKDIARSSTHTILAACGLEHRGDEVYPVQPLSICNHVERQTGAQTSLMKDRCSSCFDMFVKDVVRKIMSTKGVSVDYKLRIDAVR